MNLRTTLQQPSAAELRGRLHGMWEAVAPAWAEHAEYADARGADVGARMLELAELRPGHRVLELASGTGGLGFEAALRVAPDGDVVLSDVAAGMTAVAAARAKERRLSNVTTRVLDLEAVEEPDASFDAVLCREGLMFAVDPIRAVSEIARVLRRGGRFVAAVWGPRERNPWLGVVFDAVSEQLGKPTPPPGVPHPFSLSDSEQLADVLEAGGLAEIVIESRSVPLRAGSFDEWWTRTSALAGPLSAVLGSLDDDARRELRDRARERTRAFETAHGLDFPGRSLVASSRRP
jgi:SAM-dependent methyltransferase